MATKNNKLIAGLTAVLVLVAGVSVWLLVFAPASTDEVLITDEVADVGPATTTGAEAGFNLKVLQRQAWQALDKQLIISGLLPVKAPEVTGKANPFL